MNSIITKIIGIIAANVGKTTAAKELSSGLWQWIRPYLIEDIPVLEQEEVLSSDSEQKVRKKLEVLLQNPAFAQLLQEKLQVYTPKEKNIVNKDIRRVKKIKIGDSTSSSMDNYDRKNIVKGNVEDAEEFRLGDG